MTSPSSSDGFPSIMSRCMEVVASADKLERISRLFYIVFSKGYPMAAARVLISRIMI